eukprot:549830-Hanusia_phi.AAC.1
MVGKHLLLALVLSITWRGSESWWFLRSATALESLKLHHSLNGTREVVEEVARLVSRAESVVAELSARRTKEEKLSPGKDSSVVSSALHHLLGGVLQAEAVPATSKIFISVPSKEMPAANNNLAETDSTQAMRLIQAKYNLKLLKDLFDNAQNVSKKYEKAVNGLISNNISLAAMRAKLQEVITP